MAKDREGKKKAKSPKKAREAVAGTTAEGETTEREETIFARIRNRTDLMRFIGVVTVFVLLVFEIVICAQYWFDMPVPRPTGRIVIFGVLVGCSVLLDIMCLIEIYAVRQLRFKVMMYCFEYVILFAFCLLTGTIYLSVLFCIVLTEVYISMPKRFQDLIMFLVSCVLYIASFVTESYISDPSEPITVVGIVSDVFVGVIIIAAHFVVANVLLLFYRMNVKLTNALKEADESRAELQDAYDRLSESAVYEERNRIAGEIHDTAGHSMTTVIMQTEAAKTLIDTNPADAKRAIISANLQAKNALEQMRESVHLLAGRGEGLSLKSDIEGIITQSTDGTGIKVRCDLDDIRTDEERFRMIDGAVKESLSNGMRHGGATAFYIELKENDGKITLLVSDNGFGLGKDFREGFGIRSMREKAESLGGSLEISGYDGEGCELLITLPCAAAEDGEKPAHGENA